MDDRDRLQAWRRIVPGVTLLFWGIAFLLIHLKFSTATDGVGWQFDLLDDSVGCVLLLMALSYLRNIPMDSRYRYALQYVTLIAFALLLKTIHDHRIYQLPDMLVVLANILNVAKDVAFVVVAAAMVWLCTVYDLPNARRNWAVARNWFLAVDVVLPLLSRIADVADGEKRFGFQLSGPQAVPLVIPIFLFALIPVTLLFVASIRTQSEARQRIAAATRS